MEISRVKEVVQASPFRPLRIRTSDGKSIPVLHQEVVYFVPNQQLLIVAKEKGGLYIIEPDHITHLETITDAGELRELRKEARG